MFLFGFSNQVGFFRWGPHSDLIIMGITINTWTKYWWLQFAIAIIEISDTYTSENAFPILGFNVYNPDKKVITEFSRAELQCYSNTMTIIQSIKRVMLMIITISQIDIAMLKVIYGEITTIFTVRALLAEKTFPKNGFVPIADAEQVNEDKILEIV